jgi:hypothetical protein
MLERIVESNETIVHFRRIEQRRSAMDDAIDHRLAVLRLADLEVARVRRRLDEVASL